MGVIVNNTVISNFAIVGRLDLLQKLIGKIYITPEVLEEISDGIKEGHLFLKEVKRIIDENDWILIKELEIEELIIYKRLSQRLGIGESSCLAIAYTKWSFFSDDKSARNYARENNISLGGTFGLLISTIDEHILSKYQANELLQIMRKNRYRSPYPDIDSYYKERSFQ